MADKNRAFLLYGSYAKQINKLTDEEAGALFKKVFDCVNDEDSEIKLSPLADMVFSMIEDHLQRDKAHYDAICEKRRKAGMMGGRPRKDVEENQTKAKKANGFSENQTKAKKADTDTVTDTDTDTENETDNTDIVGQAPTPSPHQFIIEYLNEKTGSSYRTTNKATQRAINGRLSEGFTVENFKAVIDVKVKKWLNDPKMRDYLRPETLFAASHFESYLNEADTEKPKTEKPHSDTYLMLQQKDVPNINTEETEANINNISSDDYPFN